MTTPFACSMADPLDGRWFLARGFMGPRASKECAATLVRGDKDLQEGQSPATEKKLQGGNAFPLADGASRSRQSTIAPGQTDTPGKLSRRQLGTVVRPSPVNHPTAPARRPFRLVRGHRHRYSTREVVTTWPWPDFISSRESRESAFPGRKNFPLLEHHCPRSNARCTRDCAMSRMISSQVAPWHSRCVASWMMFVGCND
jgi:hypothetical protein